MSPKAWVFINRAKAKTTASAVMAGSSGAMSSAETSAWAGELRLAIQADGGGQAAAVLETMPDLRLFLMGSDAWRKVENAVFYSADRTQAAPNRLLAQQAMHAHAVLCKGSEALWAPPRLSDETVEELMAGFLDDMAGEQPDGSCILYVFEHKDWLKGIKNLMQLII